MTDRDSERVDLRALDLDPGGVDRVISVTMARVSTTLQRPVETMDDMARRSIRPTIVAATLLVAAAALAIAFVDSRPDAGTPSAATVVSWIDSRHVPTNAELLLAFQGYAR
jgi:hypothetical protein